MEISWCFVKVDETPAYFFSYSIALTSIVQLSVLKQLAGKPALLNRFGSAVLVNAKRTATGVLISFA